MVDLSFGVLTDLQFAFAPDRLTPGKSRFYQNSKEHLKDAVAHWNNENVSFVVQLGDIIDGLNASDHCRNKKYLALDAVMDEFGKSKVEVIHVLGNHELYNFHREELVKTPLFHGNKKSSMEKSALIDIQSSRCTSPVFYFTFKVKDSPGFRFVVLDTFDESILGRDETSPEYINAIKILRKHNHNEDLSDNSGLSELNQYYVMDNGGLGKQQLEWLDKVLAEADLSSENVVLFSHSTLHPKCALLPEDVVWDSEEVLELISSHTSVKLSLCGHVHDDIYHQDSNGIHHRTLSAVLEADKSSNAYATVHLSKNTLEIKGHGQVNSQTLSF